MFDQNGEIIKVNSTFTNLFLFKEQDIKSLTDIYLDQQKNQFQELIRLLQEDNHCLQFETKRMTKRWASSRCPCNLS